MSLLVVAVFTQFDWCSTQYTRDSLRRDPLHLTNRGGEFIDPLPIRGGFEQIGTNIRDLIPTRRINPDRLTSNRRIDPFVNRLVDPLNDRRISPRRMTGLSNRRVSSLRDPGFTIGGMAGRRHGLTGSDFRRGTGHRRSSSSGYHKGFVKPGTNQGLLSRRNRIGGRLGDRLVDPIGHTGGRLGDRLVDRFGRTGGRLGRMDGHMCCENYEMCIFGCESRSHRLTRNSLDSRNRIDRLDRIDRMSIRESERARSCERTCERRLRVCQGNRRSSLTIRSTNRCRSSGLLI